MTDTETIEALARVIACFKVKQEEVNKRLEYVKDREARGQTRDQQCSQCEVMCYEVAGYVFDSKLYCVLCLARHCSEFLAQVEAQQRRIEQLVRESLGET